MNIIVSFKNLCDLSVVSMQNAFKMWRQHSLMFHARETFCQSWCSLQIKLPTSTTLAAIQADSGRPLPSRLSIHCCSRFCSAICPD